MCRESAQGRLARLEDAAGNQAMAATLPEDSPFLELGPPECTTAAHGNRADVLTADIPAGGTVTGRAVARMYAALLGEVDGVRLISPARLVPALTKQTAALRARYEIEVDTALCDEPDLRLEVKEALYRIAQEALHNIVKHAAGPATWRCGWPVTRPGWCWRCATTALASRRVAPSRATSA